MLERAVIRVWTDKPQQFRGSAFLIAPGCAVTAKHVVANIPYESVYLAGPPWGDSVNWLKCLYFIPPLC